MRQLFGVKFTLRHLRDAGSIAQQLKMQGSIRESWFTLCKLNKAGVNQRQWFDAELTTPELKDARFTSRQLKETGFTLQQMKNAGLILRQLKDA